MDLSQIPTKTTKTPTTSSTTSTTTTKTSTTLSLPTNDIHIRLLLRSINHPITIFGEDAYDRRERLKRILLEKEGKGKGMGERAFGVWMRDVLGDGEMVEKFKKVYGKTEGAAASNVGGGEMDVDIKSNPDSDSVEDSDSEGEEEDSDSEEDGGEFYTRGLPQLKQTRLKILHHSLQHSKLRLQQEKQLHQHILKNPIQYRQRVKQQYHSVQEYELKSSIRVNGGRPIGDLSISPNGRNVVVGCFDGSIGMYDLDIEGGLKYSRGYEGFHSRVSCVSWFPPSTTTNTDTATTTDTNYSNSNDMDMETDSDNSLDFIGADFEGLIKLYNLNSAKPIYTFKAHPLRTTCVKIHPHLNTLLGTTSFDGTFRLFDINTQQQTQSQGISHTEVLLQEGHSQSIYHLDFHPSGALALTSALDLTRIWDLRLGKSIMFIDGHVGGSISGMFWPSGYEVRTGGYDGVVGVSDLRFLRGFVRRVCGHSSLVSRIRYMPSTSISSSDSSTADSSISNDSSSMVMMTSGFDGSIKFWGGHDDRLLLEKQHGSLVFGMDYSSCYGVVLSGGYDRTIKVWGR